MQRLNYNIITIMARKLNPATQARLFGLSRHFYVPSAMFYSRLSSSLGDSMLIRLNL
jgi:hypothetical protein